MYFDKKFDKNNPVSNTIQHANIKTTWTSNTKYRYAINFDIEPQASAKFFDFWL